MSKGCAGGAAEGIEIEDEARPGAAAPNAGSVVAVEVFGMRADGADGVIGEAGGIEDGVGEEGGGESAEGNGCRIWG